MIEMGREALALPAWACCSLRQHGSAAGTGVMIMRQVCQAGTAQATWTISQAGAKAAVAGS